MVEAGEGGEEEVREASFPHGECRPADETANGMVHPTAQKSGGAKVSLVLLCRRAGRRRGFLFLLSW